MRTIENFFQTTAKRLQQRGSALLTSLMVMVGLSLLGLAFVAISETESAISINERNHTQTVSVAESGARIVVQWFQFPVQMETLGLMPTNTTDFKIERTSGTPPYTGYYKETQPRLCDIPFGPSNEDLFFGDEESADIQITRNTAAGRTFLDDFNNQVLGPEGPVQAREGGEITEIRIYAPPLVGGLLVPPPTAPAPRFYTGGTRYGVATIMARAEKFNQSLALGGTRRSLGRAECRIVVSQFPLPEPGGPLQSATSLATNGDFNVNWGLVSAQQSLDLKKDYETIPFFNSYERVHINRGYDSSVQWAPNTLYRVGDIVRPSAAAMTAALAVVEFAVITAGTSGAAASEPLWVSALNTQVPLVPVAGQPVFRSRTTTAWPLSAGGAAGPSNRPWLYWIARGDKSIEDPWFHARSAQNIVSSATGNPQPEPFRFDQPSLTLNLAKGTGHTHHFQFQSFDQYSMFKNLLFPVINYDFWKAAAVASNGQDGVHYLQRAPAAGADQYTNGVNTKGFEAWVTSTPGYYFFETENNQNPQNGGPGILAPAIQANGGTALWTGFIYLNSNFKTTGLVGIAGNFNQPGEPYMDIGYREIVTTGPGTGDFVRDAALQPIVTGAVNEIWDFQDLPWSNSGASSGFGAGNNEFDVFVAPRTVVDPDPLTLGVPYTAFFPVPYRPGCFPGNNDCPTCNCSEPHEPYLNLRYTVAPLEVVVGWEDPGAQTRRPKRTTGLGRRTDPPFVCLATSLLKDCTSNSYDLDGGLVPLVPTNDGVVYIEGQYDSTGNAVYYGSVLVGPGGVNVKGTPQLWYDEALSRGTWRPPGLPRVLVTSVETDR